MPVGHCLMHLICITSVFVCATERNLALQHAKYHCDRAVTSPLPGYSAVAKGKQN